MFWHPQRGEPFHFGLKLPHPLLWVGIILVGAGAALVLYSKELSESPPPAQASKAPPTPVASPEVKT
jgi:hypothetical protein